MHSSSDTKSYYTILQINQDATEQEIRKSYKRLAILRHPDKNIGDFTNACAAFKELQAAYSVLSDPLSRAKYDKKLEQPVSYRETKATESPRSDFSDDETTSAPGSPRRPETPNSKPPGATYRRSGHSPVYYDSDSDSDDDDDDDYNKQRDKDDKEKEWRKGAWLDEAIQESLRKVEEYLKEMKLLMADDDYSHDEWVDIKVKLNVEMRFQDRMRRDRDALYGTGRG